MSFCSIYHIGKVEVIEYNGGNGINIYLVCVEQFLTPRDSFWEENVMVGWFSLRVIHQYMWAEEFSYLYKHWLFAFPYLNEGERIRKEWMWEISLTVTGCICILSQHPDIILLKKSSFSIWSPINYWKLLEHGLMFLLFICSIQLCRHLPVCKCGHYTITLKGVFKTTVTQHWNIDIRSEK